MTEKFTSDRSISCPDFGRTCHYCEQAKSSFERAFPVKRKIKKPESANITNIVNEESSTDEL